MFRSVTAVLTDAGSLALSQSTNPQTTSLQPPQPVVARVAPATASTVQAPSSQAETICFLVTPVQRQTVVEPGIRIGDGVPSTLPPADAGTSSASGSAGSGVRRS